MKGERKTSYELCKSAMRDLVAKRGFELATQVIQFVGLAKRGSEIAPSRWDCVRACCDELCNASSETFMSIMEKYREKSLLL